MLDLAKVLKSGVKMLLRGRSSLGGQQHAPSVEQKQQDAPVAPPVFDRVEDELGAAKGVLARGGLEVSRPFNRVDF